MPAGESFEGQPTGCQAVRQPSRTPENKPAVEARMTAAAARACRFWAVGGLDRPGGVSSEALIHRQERDGHGSNS